MAKLSEKNDCDCSDGISKRFEEKTTVLTCRLIKHSHLLGSMKILHDSQLLSTLITYSIIDDTQRDNPYLITLRSIDVSNWPKNRKR